MIYVDTSVVLAHVLAEDRHPRATFWDEVLIASQLVEYEAWVRVHAARLDDTHHEAVQATLGRIRLVSLSPEVLQRARDPFPVPVRTLDALHLATVVFLQSLGDVRLATYDARMTHAAMALGIAIEPLSL